MKYIGLFENIPIYLSDRKDKKYVALYEGDLIHFGSKLHEHYYDKMNAYAHLNHNDANRRRLYYLRFGKKAQKGTAKYFSHKILW